MSLTKMAEPVEMVSWFGLPGTQGTVFLVEGGSSPVGRGTLGDIRGKGACIKCLTYSMLFPSGGRDAIPVPSPEIGWEECLQNDLFCVELYSAQFGCRCCSNLTA